MSTTETNETYLIGSSKWKENEDAGYFHSVEKKIIGSTTSSSSSLPRKTSINLDEHIRNVKDTDLNVLDKQFPNVQEEGTPVFGQRVAQEQTSITTEPTFPPTMYVDPCVSLESDCTACLAETDCLFCRGRRRGGFCFNKWPDLVTFPDDDEEDEDEDEEPTRLLRFQEMVRILGSSSSSSISSSISSFEDKDRERLRELKDEFCSGYVTSSQLVCHAPTQPPVSRPTPVAPVTPVPTQKPTYPPPPTRAPVMRQGIYLSSAESLSSTPTTTAIVCGILSVLLLLRV
eukprot:CAMPEP_0172387748 /NCGR_PEP_ID=MMETSP1061-20121228/5004_1 /TAXON_ID=37318 /ORGANISM="Pseudo-nitzschia pungens, Strain cf. pungens" /LENGTH=286 /DNA_ID=CAMNT_0013117477 /DNA_START=169 /DNA_END=1029 /DNA_ORIENTATION=-